MHVIEEVAVVERKALWIAHHRSRVQDPVGTVLSTELPTVDHHDIIKFTVRLCVEGRGRISRSGLTQDIKMGSCVF